MEKKEHTFDMDIKISTAPYNHTFAKKFACIDAFSIFYSRSARERSRSTVLPTINKVQVGGRVKWIFFHRPNQSNCKFSNRIK